MSHEIGGAFVRRPRFDSADGFICGDSSDGLGSLQMIEEHVRIIERGEQAGVFRDVA
jgi:hypothetical protein